MNIVPMSDCHSHAYDEFLARTDAALLYHTRKYKTLLERLLGCDSQYWLAMNRGKIEGVLPLMAIQGPYGTVINSLPFYGSIGAILAENEVAGQALCRRYNEIVREPGVGSATMVSNPFDRNYAGLVTHDLTDMRIGQVTALPHENEGAVSEGILELVSGSARRNIKKAERCGIEVSVDNTAMDFLSRVHVENMKTIGGMSKPDLFFDLVQKIFVADEDYRIYVARNGKSGEPMAALLVFYFKETVEYFIPATVHEFRGQQPMAAILWNAMRDASRMGYRRWNWGGTWKSQEGVYRFKKKWGARDFVYSYYIKLNNEKILEESPDRVGKYYKNFYVVPFSVLRGEGCHA